VKVTADLPGAGQGIDAVADEIAAADWQSVSGPETVVRPWASDAHFDPTG
jgi:hypothetical protein